MFGLNGHCRLAAQYFFHSLQFNVLVIISKLMELLLFQKAPHNFILFV